MKEKKERGQEVAFVFLRSPSFFLFHLARGCDLAFTRTSAPFSRRGPSLSALRPLLLQSVVFAEKKRWRTAAEAVRIRFLNIIFLMPSLSLDLDPLTSFFLSLFPFPPPPISNSPLVLAGRDRAGPPQRRR